MDPTKIVTPDLHLSDPVFQRGSARTHRNCRDDTPPGKTARANFPSPAAVRAIRARVQAADALGNVTAAQLLCAEACGTTLRTWIEWEEGTRPMNPDLWDLTQSKHEAY
jgi:hypothetical protein